MAAALESEIEPIRALMKDRRFAEALRAVDSLSAAHPENCEVLYLRAVAQRMLGHTAAPA